MNNNISQNNKKRYLPHDINTRKYAVEMYRNCGDINYVCRKYHISRISLWRWNKIYDGTKESITDKSHRPNSKHPNAHTNQEIRWIRNYIRRNPRITLNELWAKLKREKGYTRTIPALYRVIRRLNIKFYKGMNIKDTSKKKHNKKYETPKNIGEKDSFTLATGGIYVDYDKSFSAADSANTVLKKFTEHLNNIAKANEKPQVGNNGYWRYTDKAVYEQGKMFDALFNS